VEPSPVLLAWPRALAPQSRAAPLAGEERDGDERALVEAAASGSQEALERLFRRYWPRAYRAAYLIVQDAAAAEDIAQESFLAAVRALDRFDRSRPFGPWLRRIVANRAIDAARARSLRREVASLDLAAERPAPAARPVGLGDELAAAIGRLPEDQRVAVVLRYLLEHTPGEIAQLVGVPRGTVNSRLRRGLDALATLLAGGSP
jgi:RNA polymerase sigma-70 factor (ECF subfamily)